MYKRNIRFYRLVILTGLFVAIGALQAQQKTQLRFHFLFSNEVLKLNSKLFQQKTGDTLSVETLKFYISQIECLAQGKSAWKENASYHLIDLEQESSLHVRLDVPNNLAYDQLKFSLGIDSATNVSGAMGGDLDPTKSMYWTWQSGYINVKIEGKSKACKTRNNEFQFHLGGYLTPNQCLNTIIVNVSPNQAIDLVIDLATWFSSINLAEQNHIMSPGKPAVSLSDKLANCFTVQQK